MSGSRILASVGTSGIPIYVEDFAIAGHSGSFGSDGWSVFMMI
jgi:hypothetical protein